MIIHLKSQEKLRVDRKSQEKLRVNRKSQEKLRVNRKSQEKLKGSQNSPVGYVFGFFSESLTASQKKYKQLTDRVQGTKKIFF